MTKLACFMASIRFLLLADLPEELGVVMFWQEGIEVKATLVFAVVEGFSFIVLFVCRHYTFCKNDK